jgi:hypothetical protein
MGTFTDDRAAYDEAFAAGEDRIAVLLDGKAPTTAPAAAPAPVKVSTTAPAPAPAAPRGPGFWSRLGSGLAAVGDNLADAASKVQFTAPISGARTNALAALPQEPPPGVPWRMVAILAAAILAVTMLLRKP